PGGFLLGRPLDCGRFRHALGGRVLAVHLRVKRVVASIDVEGGMGRVAVLIGQARVVMHEWIATVDPDDAERPGGIRAAALWITDVVAGRAGSGPCPTTLTGQQRGGGSKDRREGEKMTHGVGSFGGRI